MSWHAQRTDAFMIMMKKYLDKERLASEAVIAEEDGNEALAQSLAAQSAKADEEAQTNRDMLQWVEPPTE